MFLLPVFALLFWIPSVYLPVAYSYKHVMPLFELFMNIGSISVYFQQLLSITIICLTAYLLNYIVTEQELLQTKTFFTGFMYILLMSCNYTLQNFHPIIFSNLFIAIAIHYIFKTHRKEYALADFFAAGIFISIATLFYIPYFVFFPFIWVALIIVRPFVWREWVVSLFGFIMPYLYVFMYYYWFGITEYLWYDKIFYPISIKTINIDLNYVEIISAILFVALLMVSLFRTLGGIVENNTRAKNNMWLIHWVFLLSLLSIVVSPELSIKYFSATAIPLSIYFSNFFLSAKRKSATETFFVLLLFLLLVNCAIDLGFIPL